MPLWQWMAEASGAVLILVLLFGICLVVRRRVLSRHGGTFELSHRARSTKAGRGWVLGIGRYSGEELEWFRIFSLAPRPKRRWPRSGLDFTGRREPVGNEQMALYADHVVITCDSPAGPIELAMSESSLMGFQSWLEARTPGSDWDRPAS
jgi:hypothetical protein